MVARVILPWPPKELSPNARMHWAALAKAKKAFRERCTWAAREQGVRPIKADKLHLSLLFYPPSRRAYDLDNALARMKSGLDGLADVLGGGRQALEPEHSAGRDRWWLVQVEVRHA